MSEAPNVLVTGGCGYVGHLAVAALAARDDVGEVVAVDVREPTPDTRVDGVTYLVDDIRSPAVADHLATQRIASVVHLAAIVNPPPGMDEATLADIEVGGTRNVLDACVAAGVDQLVVTSSGAAYGYHPSNARGPLTEDAPLRGSDTFAYARHKRAVEELLAAARRDHPALAQLVLRPGTILGERAHNQITDLFDRPVVVGLVGADIPFVFVLDTDVAAVIARGVAERRAGIYNLAGDGTVTMREVARIQHKRYLPLPVGLVRGALAVMDRLHVTQYGPEQVDFLRYRPVLANEALKRDFPGLPSCTSAEVLGRYLAARDGRSGA